MLLSCWSSDSTQTVIGALSGILYVLVWCKSINILHSDCVHQAPSDLPPWTFYMDLLLIQSSFSTSMQLLTVCIKWQLQTWFSLLNIFPFSFKTKTYHFSQISQHLPWFSKQTNFHLNSVSAHYVCQNFFLLLYREELAATGRHYRQTGLEWSELESRTLAYGSCRPENPH